MNLATKKKIRRNCVSKISTICGTFETKSIPEMYFTNPTKRNPV